LESDKWVDDHFENKRDMVDENEDYDDKRTTLETVIVNGEYIMRPKAK
jgi:hypothetical protein